MNVGSKKRFFSNDNFSSPAKKVQVLLPCSPIETINDLKNQSKKLYPGYDDHWREVFDAFFNSFISFMGPSIHVSDSYMLWILDHCQMEAHFRSYARLKIREGCSLEYLYHLIRIYTKRETDEATTWIGCFFADSIPLIKNN